MPENEVEFNMDDDIVHQIVDGLTAAVRISYTAEYAVYVEFPAQWTGGSQPPFQPLREWVGRKWPDLGGGLKDSALSEGMTPGSDQHKKAVTWVVVKAIAENGLEGVFFGKRSLQHGRQKADSIAQQYRNSDDPEAGRKIIEDIGSLMFEKSQEIIAEEATDTGNLLQSGQIDVFESAEELEA